MADFYYLGGFELVLVELEFYLLVNLSISPRFCWTDLKKGSVLFLLYYSDFLFISYS